jgi:hypothetical protein
MPSPDKTAARRDIHYNSVTLLLSTARELNRLEEALAAFWQP